MLQEVLFWEGLCGSEENFLRPSTEVDVFLHVPAYWGVEEHLASLQKGLQGKH